MNRKLTGALADFHFAPTAVSRENLLKENVPGGSIFVTGNTVIDALNTTVQKDFVFDDPVIRKALDSGKRLILMTTHRRENLGEPMRQVYRALKFVLERHPEAAAIFPVHKNPKVREVVQAELAGIDRVYLSADRQRRHPGGSPCFRQACPCAAGYYGEAGSGDSGDCPADRHRL